MKITVRKDGQENGAEMHLFLVEQFGSVYLHGIDGAGKEWVIAAIGESGLKRATSIGKSSGWPLDERGRIELDE